MKHLKTYEYVGEKFLKRFSKKEGDQLIDNILSNLNDINPVDIIITGSDDLPSRIEYRNIMIIKSEVMPAPESKIRGIVYSLYSNPKMKKIYASYKKKDELYDSLRKIYDDFQNTIKNYNL
jgi:hypothetical protein